MSWILAISVLRNNLLNVQKILVCICRHLSKVFSSLSVWMMDSRPENIWVSFLESSIVGTLISTSAPSSLTLAVAGVEGSFLLFTIGVAWAGVVPRDRGS